MKATQQKRLKKLENRITSTNSKMWRFAKVIYDPTSEFDVFNLKIDAATILFLPDNGMRTTRPVDFSYQPYEIFYG